MGQLMDYALVQGEVQVGQGISLGYRLRQLRDPLRGRQGAHLVGRTGPGELVQALGRCLLAQPVVLVARLGELTRDQVPLGPEVEQVIFEGARLLQPLHLGRGAAQL